MKHAGALIVVALMGSAAPADAVCFLCNRSDWAMQNEAVKIGFVMGVINEATTLLFEAPETSKYRHDLASCLLDLQLTASDLIDVVDQQYQDLSNWEEGPSSMLNQGLRKACLSHMNRARAARGDEPLK